MIIKTTSDKRLVFSVISVAGCVHFPISQPSVQLTIQVFSFHEMSFTVVNMSLKAQRWVYHFPCSLQKPLRGVISTLTHWSYQYIYISFSVTWSCVSLARFTTSSHWKLLRFMKFKSPPIAMWKLKTYFTIKIGYRSDQKIRGSVYALRVKIITVFLCFKSWWLLWLLNTHNFSNINLLHNVITRHKDVLGFHFRYHSTLLFY